MHVRLRESPEAFYLTVRQDKSQAGSKKAKKLIELASNTVGEGYGPEVEITIRHLAEQITIVKREVEDLDEDIKESFREIAPNKLESVDGIGPVNAAVMTTEIWDINRFATATKLNGYVGAYPELSESGNYKDPHPDMTKKGNPRLKLLYLPPPCPRSTVTR